MKKVLFIDRDGTLALEPPIDYQLDSFEKLVFYPQVFQYLGKIAKELDFELVMVTNQDGLGTSSFPETTFWPVHNFLVNTFENEGIVFSEQIIDRTFARDNAPTRKPNIGLLSHYQSSTYDLENSFVIGDRMTDIELAKNLGAKGIYINNDNTEGNDELTVSKSELVNSIALETKDWSTIYEFLSQNKPVIAINDFETSSFLKEFNIETSSKDLETIFNYWNSLTTKNRNLLIEKMKSELNLKNYNGLIELNKYIK